MKNLKKTLALLLALLMVFALVSCGSTAETAAESAAPAASEAAASEAAAPAEDAAPAEEAAASDAHGDIVVGTTYSHLYMYSAGSNENDNYCRRLVYDQLFYVDDLTGEMTSDVLTSWEWLDSNTLSLTLRDDVYFSDGTQMTTKDILGTLRAYIDNTNSELAFFEKIDYDKTEVVDDYTINLYYAEPYGAAISTLIIPVLSADFIAAHPDGDDAWWYSPVGSGPYTVGDVEMNSSVQYVLRDDYWNKDADFKADTITVKYYTDTVAEYSDYINGDLDIILDLTDTQYSQLSADANTEVVVQSADDVLMFCFNNNNLDAGGNLAVRQAVAYGVNWNDVAIATYGELYEPATSHFATTFDCYTDHSADMYEYNPELAKQILDDAGIDPSTITLSFPYYMGGNDGALLEVVQAYLAELGITLEPNPMDIPSLIPALIAGDGDIATQSTAANGNAPKEPNTIVDTMRDYNFQIMAIPDAEYNDLCIQALAETDSAVRAELYAQIDQWLFDNFQAIPVAERVVTYCYNSEKIASFQVASTQRGSLAFVTFN